MVVTIALSFFEAFIHTAGIAIHRMKKPYTPGLITAWLMAAASVYTIYYLEANGLAATSDYILGVVLMFGSFILMDIAILRSIGVNPKEIAANMKS